MADEEHGSKKSKKSHHDPDDHHAVNKIDDLPELVLFHILSFLDAKSLVRTSVLCRRWRTLWKDTPALNFHGSDDRRASLKIHVEKLLLSLGSDRNKSLRNLSLARLWFQDPSGFSGFSSLTTLELTDCSFYGDNPNEQFPILLPFADLPSLKHLKLLHCWSNDAVIVSVPHVLDLEIHTRNISGFKIQQLLAPKLESFTFSSYVINLVDPLQGRWGHREVCFDLPSLDRASIHLVWKEVSSDLVLMQRLELVFMTLFRGMRNAKSLDLRFDKAESVMWSWEQLKLYVLLSEIKSLLVNRDSPFTALKTLKIQHPREFRSHGYQVINYRFDEDGGYVEEKSQESAPPMDVILSILHSVFVKGDQTNFVIEPLFGVEASELYPYIKSTTVDEYLDKLV